MLELAFLRNRLLNGHWDPEDQEVLLEVRAQVVAATSPYRAVALNAIDNALQDIAGGGYAQAGYELNFIHNLDLEHGFPDAWHELYFLGSYVSDYLSEGKELDRIRRLLRLLGEAVASQEHDPAYQLRRHRDRSFRATWRIEKPEKLVWVGGRAEVGLGEREKFAMKTYSDEVLWEAAVYWEPAGYHKAAWVGWPEAGVILLGGGAELFALDLETGGVRHHQMLDSYFMRLAFTPDRTRLLVLDGTSVAALDMSLKELWRTPVAVDGIILRDLDDERVYIDAELDPPGGWKPLVLDARTGQLIERA
jgi:hypothetical protein